MKILFILMLFCASLSLFAQQDSTKKQYLGVLTLTEKYKNEKNWGKADEAIVGEHFKRLVKYKEQGIVILAGRTDYETNNPDMMGLVIFYSKNDKEAFQFMMEDPAVKNKIMLARVHPYSVAISKCE
jgi:uncharacterized protein YciI